MRDPVNDWRLMGQDAYLQGRSLRLQEWQLHREGWDHDHCAFCQRHIGVLLPLDDEDAVERGWSTEDGYHWVCEGCFEDFREQFGWRVSTSP